MKEEVRFYDRVEDGLLRFAVIIAKTDGKWVFCKHRERETLEIPGGHREPGERIIDTAERELREETGAIDYTMVPVCVYSVIRGDNGIGNDNAGGESFGMLYYADIKTFEEELHSEIEKIVLLEHLAENWTYPLIQPKLIEEAARRGYL